MPGSGQTLVALGLMRALRQRNLRVQSFKCGPELADLRYHALAADREPVSLDTWMGSRSHLQTVYNRYGEKADVCVVEGRAGLFDGFRKTQGSSAEMARLMKIPVVMVVSARNAGYSTAAMLYGFKHFNTELKNITVENNAAKLGQAVSLHLEGDHILVSLSLLLRASSCCNLACSN